MQLNIAGTTRHIARDLQATQPDLVRRATTTALNRANSKVFTEAKRLIRSETGLPLKVFKKKLIKFPARHGKPSAGVWMGLGSRIPLASVNTGKKINKKWAPLVDAKSLEGSTLANAFRAKTKNGRESIFVRSGRAVSRSGRDSKGRLKRGRLPINEVVLDISKQASRAVKAAGDNHAKAAFERSLRHEIQRRQKRIGAR